MLISRLSLRTCFATAVALLTAPAAIAGGPDASADPPSPERPSDDELFRGLTGAQPDGDEADADLLERTIGRMRDAEKRIAARDSGPETRRIQQQAVEDLRRLIDLLKRQQAQSQSSAPLKRQQQQPQPSDPQDTEEQPSSADSGSEKTRKDQAEDSVGQSRQREDNVQGTETLLGPHEMATEVWGHLPPKLREKLLNVYEEKYLPKYDSLVRRYFEALAEEGRERP